MPLSAWLQAVAYVALAALGLLVPLVLAAQSAGAARLGWLLLFSAFLLITLALCWLFVPRVTLRGLRLVPGLARWLMPSPYRGRPGRGLVALTFDDGPNGPDTAAVLDALAAHGARATFFCVGQAAAAQPALLRRMVDAGHEIGNHSQRHRKLPWLSRADLHAELAEAQAALIAAGAPPPRWFRAPHGFKAPGLGSVLTRLGLRLVSWTLGVWDTDRPGADVIARRSERVLRDGAILLLHDGGGDRSQTAAALPAILAACQRRGLRPVTLSELLADPQR